MAYDHAPLAGSWAPRSPESAQPAVRALVRDDNGGILLQRAELTGDWAAPQGQVRAGETVARALERAVLNQTGAGVTVGRLHGIESGQGRVTAVVECRLAAEAPAATWEGRAWFAPDALPPRLERSTRRWLEAALEPAPDPLIC